MSNANRVGAPDYVPCQAFAYSSAWIAKSRLFVHLDLSDCAPRHRMVHLAHV